MSHFRHVLAAIEFDEAFQHTLDLAAEIANRYGAALTLVHVYTLPTSMYAYPILHDAAVPLETLDASVKGAAEASLEELLARARTTCPAAQATVRAGRPAEQILEQARDSGADLIVLGTHGRRGLSRAVFGSVAERVVRESSVPVLVAHAPRTSPAPERVKARSAHRI